jgi:hypothetical protein
MLDMLSLLPQVPGVNRTGSPLPPFALVALGPEEASGRRALLVPTAATLHAVFVCGATAVQTDEPTEVVWQPLRIAMDESDGSPTVNQEWGAVPGSVLAGRSGTGFLTIGGAGDGSVAAVRLGTPPVKPYGSSYGGGQPSSGITLDAWGLVRYDQGLMVQDRIRYRLVQIGLSLSVVEDIVGTQAVSTLRKFVTNVTCSGNTITAPKSYALAPLAAVLTVTVRRELTANKFVPVANRLVTATCTNHGGPIITDTTDASGVVRLQIPAGVWSITVALLAGETTRPTYPGAYTAPERESPTLATGAVTITIAGPSPTIGVTGTPPTIDVTITPPSGRSITSSTTTITGPA